LGQYDAQWYLKIADSGYPKNPTDTNMHKKESMDGLSYAFFPLYPSLLAIINVPIKNIELTAFLTSNLLLIANFISLYILVKNLFSKNKALKTIFLVFFFPFSIFYRSYFTEGLFLFLLIWFSYFLINKRWLLSALFISLLSITRPNGIIFELLFLFYLAKSYFRKEILMRTVLDAFIVSMLAFTGWLLFCYINTGNPMYWFNIQSVWYKEQNISFPLFHNIKMILNFTSLSWHSFHSSKIDVIAIFITGIILFFSRKKLRPELWWISFLIWVIPLLTKDTMSFTRYQIVSFPLFIYLAQNVKRHDYLILFSLFYLILLILSLFFINWYWIG
jgi:Gpi18-like mannosyltransferase